MSDITLTDCGFMWGPTTVTRRMQFDETTCTEFRTDAHTLNVYVSPKGRSIRVWLDGQELK